MTQEEPRWFSRLDRIASVSWRGLVIIIAIGVGLWLLTHITIIVIPSVFALFLCTALLPVKRFLVGSRIPNTLASLLAVLFGLLCIGVLFLAIIPPVVDEWDDLVASVETAYEDIYDWLEEGPIGLGSDQVDDIRNAVESAQDIALDRLAEGALAGVPVVIEATIGVLLAAVLTFYFLKDGDRMWAWLVHRLPATEHEKVLRAGDRAWGTLGGYLRAMAVVAVIDGIGIGLGAYVLGVPLAIPIGVLTFILAFIPIVGATVAGAVAVLIALADGGPVTALWMLGIVLFVQQFESNVIEPVVFGHSVNLHPIVVLLGITGAAGIAGILGAMFITPLIAVISVLLRELTREDDAGTGDEPQAGEAPEEPQEGAQAASGPT